VPLVFKPGEAFQFDWSEDWAYVSGERIKLQVAHIELSHRRAFLVRAYTEPAPDRSRTISPSWIHAARQDRLAARKSPASTHSQTTATRQPISSRATIALNIPRKFLLPKIGVRRGGRGKPASLVPMPIAAVDEDRRATTGKDDVETARQLANIEAKAEPLRM
jgi:hypothetical protein